MHLHMHWTHYRVVALGGHCGDSQVIWTCVPQEDAGRIQGREGGQETNHQEATQCLHAVHEGDESQGYCRMHTQGECCHQPDPGPQGEATGRWAGRGDTAC